MRLLRNFVNGEIVRKIQIAVESQYISTKRSDVRDSLVDAIECNIMETASNVTSIGQLQG